MCNKYNKEVSNVVTVHDDEHKQLRIEVLKYSSSSELEYFLQTQTYMNVSIKP